MPTGTGEVSVGTLVVAASGNQNECFPSGRGAAVDGSATSDS